MNIDLLKQHIASGLVREQSHPTLPLRILNYSASCQYDRAWDDVTLQCRGLVVHGNEIVARPFRKFFNASEHAAGEIPWHLPNRVTEKLDGSLLIWFCFDGEWIAATRGSFTSEQARIGRELILGNHSTFDFDESCTYLFEVIYPENRIVVNYGDRREVVLLAVVKTDTGDERELDGDVFNVVRSVPATASDAELRSIIRDDEEGYVVRFENSFRVKIKGERYCYLHKVISGISSRMVWENLSSGQSFAELLEIIPDECGEWVRNQRDKLVDAYNGIETSAQFAVMDVAGMATRKEQAARILTRYRDISAVVFALLDGKDYAKPIWKMLYPKYERPQIVERIES